MKFDKHFPTDQLKPYIKYFVVSENELENEYKVLPSSGLVMGFNTRESLQTLNDSKEIKLAAAGKAAQFIYMIHSDFKALKKTDNGRKFPVVR